MDADPSLRVITLNIWGPGPRLAERIRAAAVVLRDLAPDVVCIQEAPPGAAENLATTAGLSGVAATTQHSGSHLGNAVLTNLPVTSTAIWELPGIDELRSPRFVAQVVATSPAGRTWSFLSTHLGWGSSTEGIRREQARFIDILAAEQDDDTITVLGGDFNALPESSTVRYLTGLDALPDGHSTQWLDAFAVCGQGPAATSDAANPHAVQTAQWYGIDRHDLLPDRRIDYVMVRGYRYGKAGCPLAARRVLDQPVPVDNTMVTVSDHYGVLADLLDP